MRYNADVGDRSYDIEINADDSGELWASIDRVHYHVDLQCVDGQRLYSLMVGNRSYEVFVDELEGRFLVTVEGQIFEVGVRDERALATRTKAQALSHGSLELPVRAPMPGMVIAVHVDVGDHVDQGDRLLVLEAMKMENEIVALREGTVSEVHVTSGQRVGHGDLLMVIS